jgi:hypothetical protein
MVAMNGDHDHGDGEACPGCRFKAALARFLEDSHSEGRQEWHWAIGELRQHMHAALLSLDAIEAAAFGDADDDELDDDPAEAAAFAIVNVGNEISELRDALMPDDDPSVGL